MTILPQGADTQVFCEDDLSRLTWAGSTGTPACSGAPTPGDTGGLVGTGAQYSASYTYDSMNRLTSSPLGAYTYGNSAHPDAATNIGSTAWTAGYDLAGNMTCRAPSSAQTCAGTQTGWTGQFLQYDNEGRLTHWASFQHQVGTPTTDDFLYDGEGHRVEQVATSGGTTTTTTYIGGLEEITAPSGAPTSTTAYYRGLALSVDGAISYTLSDGLGSVSDAVSTSGTVTATQLYGPYGAVRYQSGAIPGTRGYTGQRADAATGLDYYNARYYDPVAGQFTSADTTLGGGLNRYVYVHGNPESRIDPTGHLDPGDEVQWLEWLAANGPQLAMNGMSWFAALIYFLLQMPPPPPGGGADLQPPGYTSILPAQSAPRGVGQTASDAGDARNGAAQERGGVQEDDPELPKLPKPQNRGRYPQDGPRVRGQGTSQRNTRSGVSQGNKRIPNHRLVPSFGVSPSFSGATSTSSSPSSSSSPSFWDGVKSGAQNAWGWVTQHPGQIAVVAAVVVVAVVVVIACPECLAFAGAGAAFAL